MVGAQRSSLDRPLQRRLDYGLLAATGVLIVAGLIAVRSATLSPALQPNFYKQLIWYAIALIPLVVFAMIDPMVWARRARWIYLINLVLLGLVDLKGHEAKGAQRWISLGGGFQFQPSEFAKLILTFTLAEQLARIGDEIKTGWGIARTLIHVGIPALFIFKQPDLGTAMVVFALWLGMTYAAGAKWPHLLAVALIGVVGFVGAWHTGVIKEYQKQRLESFLNPDADPQQSGYHIKQARIAVGSGQALGKGFGHGTQKRGRFIPEQHTDFIFAVVAEEGGFAGAMLLLAAFVVFLWRVWLIAAHATVRYRQLVAAGVFVVMLAHITVNISMAIGLAPVVGVPLPFISYGGSITMVAMSFIGALLAIRMREGETVFVTSES